MAEICSFCKREVTNNVCCDYCGTPIIFSDFDIEENKEKNTYEPSEQISDDVTETLEKSDKIFENEQNFNEEQNCFDDIKIRLYNDNKDSFDGNTTKVVNISDIKKALANAQNDESAILCNDNTESENNENEEIVFQSENDKTENTQNSICDEEDNVSTHDIEKNNADNIMYNVADQNFALQKEPYKGDTKLTKFLKNTLGVMFLLGLVSLFFPALSPTELTPSLSFSIIDVVLLIATSVGMCLAFFEKNGIRKFIFGIIFSIVFLGANIVISKPFPPKNTKEAVVLVYLAIMLVISLIGHMSDRHTTFEKMQIWFDSFNYVAFFINLFAIALSIMIWIVMPDNMIEGIKPYLIGIVSICAVAIVGIFLMFKRKIAGANLFMFTSILIIVLSMVAYHNIINTIGYYNSVISLMNVIGGYYSKFIAILVAFPIIMFAALSSLNKKQVK